MVYKFNNEVIPQPSKGKWINPKSKGDTTSGKPLYPGVYEYELFWGVLSPFEYWQLEDFVYYSNISGSLASAVLPAPAPYSWRNMMFGIPYQTSGGWGYTGTVFNGVILENLEVGEWFEGYVLNVKLVVRNVIP